MKLRQREFCHNCNQEVEFEFDDVTERQVIYCPNCGHEHYREIDASTITRIRINPCCREMRIAKPIPMQAYYFSDLNDNNFAEPIVAETIQLTEEQRRKGVVEKLENAKVSDRRWGRDPRQ